MTSSRILNDTELTKYVDQLEAEAENPHLSSRQFRRIYRNFTTRFIQNIDDRPWGHEAVDNMRASNITASSNIRQTVSHLNEKEIETILEKPPYVTAKLGHQGLLLKVNKFATIVANFTSILVSAKETNPDAYVDADGKVSSIKARTAAAEINIKCFQLSQELRNLLPKDKKEEVKMKYSKYHLLVEIVNNKFALIDGLWYRGLGALEDLVPNVLPEVSITKYFPNLKAANQEFEIFFQLLESLGIMALMDITVKNAKVDQSSVNDVYWYDPKSGAIGSTPREAMPLTFGKNEKGENTVEEDVRMLYEKEDAEDATEEVVDMFKRALHGLGKI